METVTFLQLMVDISLGLGLIWLAWQALISKNMFRGIVLFVTFGLLMALVWVRLDAPDVALTEAAIGAGLTGALLMTALSRLQDIESVSADKNNTEAEKYSDIEKDHRKTEGKND